MFAWQMLLGIGSCVLIYFVTGRCFGTAAAGVAGLLAALCSPLLYYELVLVRETLIVHTGLLVVLLTLRALERPNASRWLVAGMALGFAILVKSTFVLFAVLLAGGMAAALRRDRTRLGRMALASACGLLLVMLPPAVRNLVAGTSLFGLASSGTITFVSHNAADYDAEAGGFFVSKNAAEIMGAADGSFVPAAIATLRTHTLGSYLAQVVHKAKSVWHWFEAPDNSNFYLYRHRAWVLYLPATFLIVGPLSLVGLILGMRSWRSGSGRSPAWPLYLLVVTSLVALIAFMVMSRVRVPLVAALIPFAGLTSVRVYAAIRQRRWLASAATITAVLAAAVFIGRPLPPSVRPFRTFDFVVESELTHAARIRSALEASDLPAAEQSFRAAITDVAEAIRSVGKHNVESGGLGADGFVARKLFDAVYQPLVTQAANAQDWRRAADLLRSFTGYVPESISRLGASTTSDQNVWRIHADIVDFYRSTYGDCATLFERAGDATTARSFRERAQKLDQALKSAPGR